jgi:iron complex transport system substrate-binding protein
MKTFTYFYLIFISLALWACGDNSPQNKQGEKQAPNVVEIETKEPETYPKFKRIVCLGERVIEAVYALGDSSKIVAIDRSYDVFPYLKVPKVGYKSTLKASYILKHRPDAVFMEANIANEEEVAKLKAKNIPCFVFEQGGDLKSAKGFVKSISKKLNKEKQGQKIVTQIDEQFKEVSQILKKRKDSLRVLYVHARGSQALMLAGANTATNGLILLSGAKNAANDYEGMERLSQDEMAYINPDILLMSQKSLDSFEGKIYEALPLTSSFAYRMGRVIILEESELLNFGVNVGKSALKIADQLYRKQSYKPLPLSPVPYTQETPTVTSPSTELEIIDEN